MNPKLFIWLLLILIPIFLYFIDLLIYFKYTSKTTSSTSKTNSDIKKNMHTRGLLYAIVTFIIIGGVIIAVFSSPSDNSSSNNSPSVIPPSNNPPSYTYELGSYEPNGYEPGTYEIPTFNNGEVIYRNSDMVSTSPNILLNIPENFAGKYIIEYTFTPESYISDVNGSEVRIVGDSSPVISYTYNIGIGNIGFIIGETDGLIEGITYVNDTQYKLTHAITPVTNLQMDIITSITTNNTLVKQINKTVNGDFKLFSNRLRLCSIVSGINNTNYPRIMNIKWSS